MIARERLRTSRMRSCFRSILVEPVADAGPAPPDAGPDGLLWLSPDIETAPHLLGVLKHSRKLSVAKPLSCETAKNSSGEETFQLAKGSRSEEHTSELQSPDHLVCRLLLEK